LLALRKARQWKTCVQRLSETKLYGGIREMLEEVRSLGVPIGIVTTSVSFYAEKVLARHRIPYDRLIAYHDCKPPKPHPAPIRMCLGQLSAVAEDSLGIGDSLTDAQAYRTAGLRAWGAGWSAAVDRDAAWSRVIEHPDEVAAFFRNAP
jgi:HAD superfamily hydrolase (TIGR01549 family)